MTPSPLLIVCDFNGHGGTQTQVLELLGAIDRARFRPMLATLTLDAALKVRLDHLEIPVENLALRGALRPKTWTSLRRLGGRIRREGVRIVHGFLFQGNLVAALAARAAAVPYLTSVRNLELWKRPHEILASRWAHAGAARVTFNSRHVRDRVEEREGIPRDRTRVIPNGLGIPPGGAPAGAPWPAGADPRLICVASLSAKKGHLVLLQAFAHLVKTFPEAGLLLVGEGPERDRIERRAEELGLGPRVTLAGRRDDARVLIAAADLLVLPSLEEGTPNVVIEAMAAGIPQVATAVGGTPEVVDEGATGFLVPPRDPVLMAERIVRLVSNDALRASFAAKGREVAADRHSVRALARAHEDLYSEVLEEAG